MLLIFHEGITIKTMKSIKYESIGVRIKAVRTAFFPDMTIAEYAKILNFNYTRYLNWESGLNRPQPDDANLPVFDFLIDLLSCGLVITN